MLPTMSVGSTKHPTIAIVGAGNLGSALALSLSTTKYRAAEIVSRKKASSLRRATTLGRRVRARVAVLEKAEILSDVVWLCVPDRDIRPCAKVLARSGWQGRFAFHSSGVLTSDALEPLRRLGASVASVHPLMTFVPSALPSFEGVAFAMEGDQAAVTAARKIVLALGGTGYRISAEAKALYHAWATFTSPLLTILLEAGERVARSARISPARARQRAAPILRQTVENYVRQGAAPGFSGPIVRGDAATVRRHLDRLQAVPVARDVYLTLARAAMRTLPVRNRAELKKLLG
jgi:predicted short-subunit dehydrogenase-like oxidoreductase (DUF2520 family)